MAERRRTFNIFQAAGGANLPVVKSFPVTATSGQITVQLAIVSYGSIISGIQFSNIEIACVKEDLRPAFVLQEVKGAEFFRVIRYTQTLERARLVVLYLERCEAFYRAPVALEEAHSGR